MFKGKRHITVLFLIITIFIVGCSIVFFGKTLSNKEVNDSVVLRFDKCFQYSTEGASLIGCYGKDNKIEYLNVDILGDLGKEIYEYTFEEDYIIYVHYEIHYSEPFYLSDGNIKIEKMENHKYVMFQNEMYEITVNDELIRVSEEEFANEKIKMQDFVNEIEKNGECIVTGKQKTETK